MVFSRMLSVLAYAVYRIDMDDDKIEPGWCFARVAIDASLVVGVSPLCHGQSPTIGFYPSG
jgi:hypothetical protein